MNTSERYRRLKAEYLTPENVRNMAYRLWEEDVQQGHCNGDEVVETAFGLLPRRDYHWLRAETILEHFADTDAD